jgi:DNA transformation protein
VAAKKAPMRRLRSLKVTDAFRTFVLDQLDGLDEVVPRAMFGGVGLYCRGVFFGILASDVLYLKVDDTNRRDYERAGMTAFTPFPDRPGSMSYFSVPLDVLENASELTEWARKSVDVARRAEGRRARR